jgi:hypothetical protein
VSRQRSPPLVSWWFLHEPETAGANSAVTPEGKQPAPPQRSLFRVNGRRHEPVDQRAAVAEASPEPAHALRELSDNLPGLIAELDTLGTGSS